MRAITFFIKRPETAGILILVLSHLIAAVFSTGFHHPDEHCQILDFAAYAVGQVEDPAALRWEFQARIRPWFQPLLHAALIKPARMAGLFEPHAFALLFRLLYALGNIAALWTLWRVVRDRYQIDSRWFLWISSIWFFPYIHVRTSSENLSGILLTFAAARLMGQRSPGGTGLLLGAAFLARYQIALGLVGLAAALLLQERKITKSHLRLLGGFIACVGFGFVIDRFFYGAWTFTPWNYFKVNLMDGVAATYSPQPWTQYFAWILLLNPFWSLPLFWGSLRFWFRDLREGVSAFVWAFFFFHVLMTNKDFRFLFPVLNLAAVMAAASLSGRTALWWHPGLLSIQGVTACLGFIYTSLQSAAIPELWAIETMHRYRHEGGTWITPGMDLNPLKQSYYPVPPLPVRECRTPAELRLCLSEISGAKVLVSFRRNEPASEAYLKELTERGCRRIESTHPDWLFRLEGRFSALGRLKYKAMYRCLSL